MLLLVLSIIGIFWSSVSQYDDTELPTSSRDAAIVLGAALWSDQPSPALKERLEVAIDLYKKKRVQTLILSGGQGDDTISEAEGMKRYLLKHQIPEDALQLENRSTNTRENLINSKFLFKKNNIDTIYIVTHDYHMKRALSYAKQNGINAFPAVAHSTVLFTPFWKARECIALAKEAVLHP